MTSQPGLQTIAIHILANISQNKGNQTRKFGQLIEYNKKKWGRETSSRSLFYFFKKLNMKWKQLVCSLVQYIAIALNLPYNKNKLHKTLDYWLRDMLNFNFSENGQGLVSPSHFVHEFWRKMFLMLHFINWPNFIV